MKKDTINKIVQIIITILTAISSTILVQSCKMWEVKGLRSKVRWPGHPRSTRRHADTRAESSSAVATEHDSQGISPCLHRRSSRPEPREGLSMHQGRSQWICWFTAVNDGNWQQCRFLFCLSIYNIIRCKFPVLSKNAKTFRFSRKKFWKYLQGWKIVRTFASAFALKFGAEGKKREFFERLT